MGLKGFRVDEASGLGLRGLKGFRVDEASGLGLRV